MSTRAAWRPLITAWRLCLASLATGFASLPAGASDPQIDARTHERNH